MAEIEWPAAWQDDAITSVEPYFGVDQRLRIIVGNPETSIDGSVIEGFVYLQGSVPMIIHDKSGRADVYPWKLLSGPVLRVYALRPRRKALVLFAHTRWEPRHGV